jgi:Histidine kinase
MTPAPDTAVPAADAAVLRPSPERIQRASLPVVFAWSLALNTTIATVLWLVASGTGSWWQVWVHSQCIGLSITALSVAATQLPWVREPASPWLRVALFVPAAPLGFLLGHALARRLLGLPTVYWHREMLGPGVLLTTVLATALAAYVYFTRERLAEQRAARARAEQLVATTELRLLRAQLEPHMLFNTLANLRALIGEDPAQAQSMLDSLIVFLRGVLAASRQERHSLEQEFAQLTAYLQLVGIRMGERLQWQLDLPAALRVVQVPPLLLQPLVENAVKHGVERQVGAGRIDVSAAREGGFLVLRVADTGAGLTSHLAGANESNGASYGLAHVRERLRSAYPANGAAVGSPTGASLSLLPNSPRGAVAELRIPL